MVGSQPSAPPVMYKTPLRNKGLIAGQNLRETYAYAFHEAENHKAPAISEGGYAS